MSTRPSENPLESLRTCLAFDPRDMGKDSNDAWVYGIAVGWDDVENEDQKALAEVAALHGWSSNAIERLRRLHAAFDQMRAEKHLQLAQDRLSTLLGTVPNEVTVDACLHFLTVGEVTVGQGPDMLAAYIDALFRIANDGVASRSVAETPHADHVRAAMRALRETLDDDEPEPTATIEAGRHRLYNLDGNEIGSGTDPLAALINALHRQVKRAQHRASKAEKINDAFRRALALLGEEA